MSEPTVDCAGHQYTPTGPYAKSSHRCPAGKCHLCEECATKGKGQCPEHRVPITWR